MISEADNSLDSKKVYKIRDRAGFFSFVNAHTFAVIVAYHYLCPQCKSYLEQLRGHANEFGTIKELGFGKIHIQLEWMIKKASLKGDVEEENRFLEKYQIGDKVPSTVFFQNGNLVWKLDGAIPPQIFRGIVKKLLSKNNDY